MTVTTAGGATSAGYDFDVVFGYGLLRWAGSSVAFRVNPNCADTTQERSLMDAAAATWSAPADFTFTDIDTCSTIDWLTDGHNDAFWSSSLLPSGVIATAAIQYSGSTILEVDICFNDTYLWGDGSLGAMDVQSVALHEMGHWLMLRDLYGGDDSTKVMYGFGSAGVSKRSLTAADEAGIVWIYGSTLSTYTLTYAAGPGGTLVGESPQTVTYGGSGSEVVATPDTGYHFVGWSDGYPTAARTDTDVTADVDVTATFALDRFTLTLHPGWNLVSAAPGTTFPNTLFGWNGSFYVVTSTPSAGQGYWCQVDAQQTVAMQTVDGPYATSLANGWNLIGNSMGSSAALTLPAGRSAFIYNPITRSYEPTLTLLPGQGAWVLGEAAGEQVAFTPFGGSEAGH